MAIEIVDFPIKIMVIFHSYVKLPEGKLFESKWIHNESKNVLQLLWVISMLFRYSHVGCSIPEALFRVLLITV